ncbi:capsule synthesis protein PGA_cap [Caldithrix abyssi DSM 13497]|uniref:Capsule synthesis protein PGA_cap n=1 Tax=Caldithrix abyssi DSM 13497 TaxID=880073 RepID=A0A1J1CC73_CALAY|nr:capsule synthesis protein PGA_cap [Caldithrix abyssi DSM 13497]
MMGDIAINGLFLLRKEEDNKKRIEKIAHLFCRNLGIIANFEVPIIGNKNNFDFNKDKHFYTYTHVVKTILPLLQIKVVSLANNHIYDCGLSGVKKTIDVLDDLNILHTGAGIKSEHVEPAIFDLNNKSIAVLAYVDKSTHPSVRNNDNFFINYIYLDKITKDIREVRKKADIVVISLHWGKDYSNFFTKKQQELAHAIIDRGADVIMGHHPHTIQPYEIYKGKPIFYSLGQLCFGDFYWEGELRALKRKTKVGMIVKLDVNDLKNFSIILTKEHKGNYISILDCNVKRKFAILSFLNKLKINYSFFNWVLNVKESYIDRIYEYFFGYYRNPLKQLFNIKNFRKIKFLIRDYKGYE